MFRVIEPYAHEFYEEKIDTFLGLLKIYQNFYLSFDDHDKATFIIAEDDKRGVYGGAVLYPCRGFPTLEFLPEDMQHSILERLFSPFHQEKEFWTARIGLYLGNDSSTPLIEAVKLYQNFYNRLYKAFCEFGDRKKLKTLSFTLCPREAYVDHCLRILTYQRWPNLKELRFNNNGDFFHGLLVLKDHSHSHKYYQKFLNLRASKDHLRKGFSSSEKKEIQ